MYKVNCLCITGRMERPSGYCGIDQAIVVLTVFYITIQAGSSKQYRISYNAPFSEHESRAVTVRWSSFVFTKIIYFVLKMIRSSHI